MNPKEMKLMIGSCMILAMCALCLADSQAGALQNAFLKLFSELDEIFATKGCGSTYIDYSGVEFVKNPTVAELKRKGSPLIKQYDKKFHKCGVYGFTDLKSLKEEGPMFDFLQTLNEHKMVLTHLKKDGSLCSNPIPRCNINEDCFCCYMNENTNKYHYDYFSNLLK